MLNNGQTVYLCEKPSQARTLAKHLGADTYAGSAWHTPDIIVVAALGHMINLVSADEYLGAGQWNIADLPIMPNQWVWAVSSDPKVRSQFDAIGTYLKQATHVILATDPDDEGEVIGREILAAHGYKGRVSRLWVSALNANGLQTALSNLLPLSATESNYRAGRIRRMMDWLFGSNLSRAYSVNLGKTARIGRVKTKLLSELVMRERTIASFKAVETKVITGKFLGVPVELHAIGRDFTNNELDQFSSAREIDGVVASYELVSHDVVPPLPYSLTTLLADAADSGISLQQGYAATQSLYEAGAISYPRTNSKTLPGQSNNGFAAHSAIHVTGNIPADAGADVIAIYNLVNQNIQMQYAVNTQANHHNVVIDFDGNRFGFEFFSQNISELSSGDEIRIQDIEVRTVQTSNTTRFTEGSLLRWMDELGIGTDATRVESIGSLVRDGVAIMKDGVFYPSNAGIGMINALGQDICGNCMTDLMSDAIENARHGKNTDTNLLNAIKWIVKVMPAA